MKRHLIHSSSKLLLLLAALSASITAQASIITYTFSGTVNEIDDKKLDDADSFGFAINNIISGSFSVDSSLAPTGGNSNKSEYTTGINFSFSVASADGTAFYTSEDTSTDLNVSNDIKITVEDNKDKFKIEDKDSSFRAGVSGSEGNNSAFLLDFDKFKIEVQDSTKTVFSDSSLPLTLDLNSFNDNHRKMELKFVASGGKELKILGALDAFSVSTETLSTGDSDTTVPIPAGAWLFLSAIAGLGLAKQRR